MRSNRQAGRCSCPSSAQSLCARWFCHPLLGLRWFTSRDHRCATWQLAWIGMSGHLGTPATNIIMHDPIRDNKPPAAQRAPTSIAPIIPRPQQLADVAQGGARCMVAARAVARQGDGQRAAKRLRLLHPIEHARDSPEARPHGRATGSRAGRGPFYDHAAASEYGAGRVFVCGRRAGRPVAFWTPEAIASVSWGADLIPN